MTEFPPGPQQIGAGQLLPDPLPTDPMPTLALWVEQAGVKSGLPNPNAFALATADGRGRPRVRIVLAKQVDVGRGLVTFFTNRESRKGRDLSENPRAAGVFHWDALDMQARVEGPVTACPDAESDAYFASRWVMSRVGAWASDQSKPIGSRDELLAKVVRAAERFNVPLDGSAEAPVPRPPHWGGYYLWAERVELWLGQPGRIHDRAEWVRELKEDGRGGFRGGPWRSTRLQP